MIRIKRSYEPPARGDGRRILVERLWPRGIRKEDLHASSWEKDVAPSAVLREWYAHDVSRWPEFRRRYREELNENPAPWHRILSTAKNRKVTLLFSARDVEHNSAVVLRDYLTERMALTGHPPPPPAAEYSGDARMRPEARADQPTMEEIASAQRIRLDALLDEGLRQTLPASDPVAVSPSRKT
jgi:uncharacterized protein YeaO (DUF488 family)